MMQQRGFTLIELMVVVSITLLLLGWGIPSYSTWKKQHDVENQMIQLYSDLQFGRMYAYGNKVTAGVWWGGGNSIQSYQIRYDNSNPPNYVIDDTGIDKQIGSTVSVMPDVGAITVTCSPAGNQNSVNFDGRGFLSSAYGVDTASSLTFSVAPDYGAGIDCVAVSFTQIILGKMNEGTCKQK